MQEFASICEQAARQGGAQLRHWSSRFSVREKGPADLVTDADFASQQAIRDIVLTAFPDHGFLGEESGDATAGDGEFRWIVDPLDGTTNYVHQLPQYCVSVALEQRGQVLVGAIFDPVGNECFTAIRGGGAYLNGQRLHVTTASQVGQALLAVSFPTRVKADAPEVLDFLTVLPLAQAMRRMGSSALNLAYLAAGRLDGYWALDTKSWDVAAGLLLVSEAGGVATDFQGQPIDLYRPRFLAAATPALHLELRSLLQASARATAK